MATRALAYALDVHDDAQVTVLHVVGEPTGMMGEAARVALDDDPMALAEELSEPVFATAREIAIGHGAEVRTTVGLGNPAREVVDRAADYDAVVLGSHGGSLADRIFTGDVAERVVEHAPVPVTVVR